MKTSNTRTNSNKARTNEVYAKNRDFNDYLLDQIGHTKDILRVYTKLASEAIKDGKPTLAKYHNHEAMLCEHQLLNLYLNAAAATADARRNGVRTQIVRWS